MPDLDIRTLNVGDTVYTNDALSIPGKVRRADGEFLVIEWENHESLMIDLRNALKVDYYARLISRRENPVAPVLAKTAGRRRKKAVE